MDSALATQAKARIDRVLWEDAPHYDFDSLRDRFTDAVFEAQQNDDDRCWIKIPSGSEMSFPTATVAAALKAPRR